MRRLFLPLAFLFSQFSFAQQVRPGTSAQIYNEIARLKNLTNVLYFAAHPDDENTRLLAWLANDQHIRTAYLSLTRGDGGQNILGKEQGAALGLIRTHELIEARRLDGAEQFFTRAIDFGFSKTHQETFKHWNEDLLVSDAVWVIRKFRPDVIICRFPPNEQAGHGQHAASAIIAEKAFAAAGDPTKYPDQLKYYPVWKPKRILFNSFRFGDRSTIAPGDFKLAVGQYSALIGMGYGELAGISRSIHKSQGAGTPSTPGVQTETFRLVAGEPITNSLFDGVDITWKRANRPEVGKEIDQILHAFDFRHPENSLGALLELRKDIEKVKDDYWRTQKLAELDEIIMQSTGLMAELYAKQPEAVAGSTLPFAMRLIARSSMPVTIQSISWPGGDTTMNYVLPKDSLITIDRSITIPAGTPVTEPYWLQQQSEDIAHFVMPHDTLRGYPEAPNNLNAIVNVKVDGRTYPVPVPLSYKKLDPTRGDVIQNIRIVPPVALEFTAPLLVTAPDGSLSAGVRIHALKDINAGMLFLNSGKGTKEIGKGFQLAKNTDTTIYVSYTAKELAGMPEDFTLAATLSEGDSSYTRTKNLIQYEHIPTLQYFTKATTKVLRSNWQSTAKRIGFIEGAGDLTPDILRLAGLQVDVLKPSDIDAERLKKYDAVLTGIRAINTERRMGVWMPELMRYVAGGGTLVMQYNTTQDMATTMIGPYPITLGRERVTEEDAAIEFIVPDHKLLNHPNKITQADFAGWVQERGLYYPSKWDEKYQTIFKMNDAGEAPLTSATLYTQFGKGHYVYAPLSFFRQLPAGNKGAIRLLLNMLSVGK